MNIRINYCYTFNCIYNTNGYCTKEYINIGNNGSCMFKTIDKHKD